MKLALHRGLEKLGKAIASLTVLLLVAALVGGPIVAILTFTIIATVYVAPIVGGGAWPTTIVLMSFLTAFCFFAGVYVAPPMAGV
jgi:hypothetical protein